MGYRIWRFILLGTVLSGAAAGFACGHAPSNPGLTPMNFSTRQTRVPGEYLVTLVSGADSKTITGLYGRFGIKGIKDIGHNIFFLTLTEDPGPEKMEELRKQNNQIKAVQPNFVYKTIGPENVH